ncbi:MAG: DsbC family protein [Variovorax sp.]|nr:DsbC family protein [Variovorax sp.]
MTFLPTLRRLAAPALAALALSAAFGANAGEAEIRKSLAAIPQLAKIDEVRKSPMPGIWEVRVGFDLYYTDDQGSYLMQGQLIDVKAKKNLTEERVDKLSQVAFDQLPVKDAFKIVRGNGKRKLAVFEDPKVYLFLYPVLGPDSVVKSRDIWCSKDKGKTWTDWMVGGVKPASGDCDVAALKRNVEFGRKYNITGTPTLIFADGSRAPGAIPAAQVEKMLAASN